MVSNRPNRKRSIPLQVLLNEEEHKMLLVLSERTGMNISNIIRQIIRSTFKTSEEERKAS